MVATMMITQMITMRYPDHSTLIHRWFLDLDFSKLTVDVVSI